jgi:CBS domain containing-hemolysin-like protein
VAGEFGLVAVDRAAIQRGAQEGSQRAKSTLGALRSLSFQLSGAQLGITVTSLVVGFLAEPAIAPAIEPMVDAFGLSAKTTLGISIGIALAIATAVEMVIAELIPKNLAIARPQRVALATAPPLALINRLLRWVIVFLNSAANWTVRRLGIEPQEELLNVRSLQELELLIRSSGEGGGLMADELELLTRSISFASKTASDALVPRVNMVALQADNTLADLTQQALESGHSRFPVYGTDLDDIIGIAHVKDVYRFPLQERASKPVSAISQPTLFVPESRDLESLLIEMRRERKQMAIVFDEFGGTSGIVTIEDLLEEIVGEIEDEYDPGEVEHTAGVPDGVYVVSGLLHPDEVEDLTGFEMPDGPYDTVAGFLLALLDRIPSPGDHCSWNGWEFKIVEMDRKRIDKVLVVQPRAALDEAVE